MAPNVQNHKASEKPKPQETPRLLLYYGGPYRNLTCNFLIKSEIFIHVMYQSIILGVAKTSP